MAKINRSLEEVTLSIKDFKELTLVRTLSKVPKIIKISFKLKHTVIENDPQKALK
jgi:hypothetical protein